MKGGPSSMIKACVITVEIKMHSLDDINIETELKRCLVLSLEIYRMT